MGQTINTNVMSLNAQRNLATTQGSLATSMQRLSSGMRVNSAKDDAAGLAIAERMNTQIRGMNVAIRNANDAISLSQTSESALGKISDSLQRMRELAVQSRNGTNSDTDRSFLQKEFEQLQSEIGRIVRSTNFNGQPVFSTSAPASITFQIGANASAEDVVSVDAAVLEGTPGDAATIITNATSAPPTATPADILTTAFTTLDGTNGIAIGTYDVGGTPTIASDTDIANAISVLDSALNAVLEKRAEFGAIQNRFEAVISNLQVASENQSAARGRIMDADFAMETANLSRAQILQQAGTAMVAQANQLPQQVLQLLQR
jgi:flagellin